MFVIFANEPIKVFIIIEKEKSYLNKLTGDPRNGRK